MFCVIAALCLGMPVFLQLLNLPISVCMGYFATRYEYGIGGLAMQLASVFRLVGNRIDLDCDGLARGAGQLKHIAHA